MAKTNPQVTLFCVLEICRMNMKILHWKMSGPEFDMVHKKITDKYAEKITGSIDDVAEKMLMCGINPPNYSQVLQYLSLGEIEYEEYLSSDNFSRDTALLRVNDILCKIVKCIDEVLSSDTMQLSDNAGIRSDYETMQFEYSKEWKYLNRRRITQPTV